MHRKGENPLARGRAWLRTLLLASLAATSARAQDTDEYFAQNCASCHTIGGGRLTGPDLKHVSERKGRAWLVRFIVDPQALLSSGDPYALRLKEEARGVVMPKAPGMTPARAEKLLDLIAEESALERSRFAGASLSDRPFTPEDIARGRELFLGHRGFASGAPSCVSCHSVEGIGGLGGGLLGPDLSDAYARLEGRKVLGAWLAAPPTPTMGPVFKERPMEEEEILGLLAFMKDSAESGAAAGQEGGVDFIVFGTAAAVGVLLLFDLLWRWRFTGVRRRLVRGRK